MTNIVFRKVKESDGTTSVPAQDQVRLGMVEAGDRINKFLRNGQNNKERLVKRLYKSMVEKTIAEGNDGVYEMCMLDQNTQFHVLAPKRPRRYVKFVSDIDPDLIVKLTVRVDDEGFDADDDFINMNVVVPASSDDLLDGGYLDTVVNQIEKLSGPLNNKDEIEKYLLANIFLTRCH